MYKGRKGHSASSLLSTCAICTRVTVQTNKIYHLFLLAQDVSIASLWRVSFQVSKFYSCLTHQKKKSCKVSLYSIFICTYIALIFYLKFSFLLFAIATPMKIKQQDAELGSGSGQINPMKALHPGLLYDISMSSYISFLCKQGYNSTTIRLLTGGKKLYNCSTLHPARGTDGLNYPSMHLQLPNPNSTISAAFYRTVTNVGYKNSVYTAKVKSPEGLEVTVMPTTLSFNRLHQKRSFKVVVKGKFVEEDAWILSALLEWSDSKYSVRSPIVVYRQLFAVI